MALTSGKNGKAHVLEISNRVAVQKITLTDVTGITASLENHYSGLNTNAHQIGNIAGLQTVLDNKVDAFTGYTGVLNVVTAVDFVGETVTTKTVTYNNGVVTSVV